MKDLLHRPALAALLDEATTPQKWMSRRELARDCGFAPATFSMALKGERSLSEPALNALLEQTGWPRDALIIPERARPGDLETARLTGELKRLREQMLRGTDEIARAIRERGD